MADTMAGLKRTHYCGVLRLEDVGREVTVCGHAETERLGNADFY